MSAKLTVLTGPQQGAVAWLMPGVVQTIGSSLDDDLVIRDASVEKGHVSLHLNQNRITLCCQFAGCLVNGTTAQTGDSLSFENMVLLQIGAIGLNIQCVVAPAHKASADPVHTGVNRQLADDEQQRTATQDSLNTQDALLTPSVDDLPLLAEKTAAHELLADKQSPSTGKWLPGTLMITALFICAGIVWQSGLLNHQPVEQFVDLESALATLPFAGLRVEQSEGRAIVSGYVESVKDSQQLKQWLDQTGLQIKNEVVVSESLGEQVFDVFRVNGVAAEVKVSDGANVLALTKEDRLDLLNDIKQRIRQDVPAVVSLTISNTPPEVRETAPIVDVDAGKRVAMVVSDEPAFIVTQDQSRYFIGSLLPTGHRIQAIEDGVVYLVRNGVTSTLEF